MKPILFNTEMTRAILDGRKTQTRRIVKPRHGGHLELHDDICGVTRLCERDGTLCRGMKPPYEPGDILYVRETWQHGYWDAEGAERNTRIFFEETDLGDAGAYGLGHFIYKADASNFDDVPEPDRWRPSIHMPKEAARLFLRVTDVRVERLQDINTEGIKAEGIIVPQGFPPVTPYSRFADLWDSTIKLIDLDRYGWNANPWVWAYTFERCEKEADNG